jgi:transcriptional regulator with XRE-family HTH domain
MTTNHIADNIRKARLARGMTQEQLGAAAGGRSVNQINGYERGRSRPSPPVLLAIAQALGATPASLLADPTSTRTLPTEGSFVQLFKKRCATAFDVPISAIKLTIEIVQ